MPCRHNQTRFVEEEFIEQRHFFAILAFQWVSYELRACAIYHGQKRVQCSQALQEAFGVAIFVGGDALFNDDSTFHEEV